LPPNTPWCSVVLFKPRTASPHPAACAKVAWQID